jgi:arsenite-transporting ATPase
MRIILYTGKGGVGKTSVAAATALRTSRLGYRTLVMSTDAAHSLADAFDIELGPEPHPVTDNLWGQEVDIFHEIRTHWGTLQAYLTALIQWRGLDELIAEEMTILPGMEELASLLQILKHYETGQFDVIVVDCAPTGETLRLLSFPEVAQWWLEKIFPIERQAARLIRPVAQRVLDMPFPGDEVFESVKTLFERLGRMRALLADKEMSTVRLVLNPEKMVIKEAQRTFTYLNLYGYLTDAIVCNRLLPAEVSDSYFTSWKETQGRYRHLVEEAFAPLPILPVPLFDQEVVGLDALDRMGQAIFGDSDPSHIMYRTQPHLIDKVEDGYVLSIPLPFAEKGDVELYGTGDELIIRLGMVRRNIVLPRALVEKRYRRATFQNGVLRIEFSSAPRQAATQAGRR